MSAALPLGALLRREVVTQLRRVRSFVTILVVMLIVLWILAASWPSSNSIVWSQLSAISTGLMTGIVFYLLIGAGLFVPGIAGTAVVVEREQQSWELLALTQLRPASIVAGKAMSAVGIYLLLIIALFPVFGSLYFLVGIDWAQTVVSLSLVLLTAFTCSMVGVAASAWAQRTGPAIASAYVGMLFVMGLPTAILSGLITIVTMMVFNKPFPYATLMMTVTSPFPVLTMSSFGGWMSFGQVWGTFAAHAGYQCALILVAFFLAVAGVKRRKFRMLPAGESFGTPPPLPKQRVPLRQRLRERRWRRRKPRPPIPDRRNAMAVREIWWGAVGSGRTIRAVGLLLLGVSAVLTLILMETGLNNVDTILPASIGIHWVLINVLCAGMCASLFTKELELRGADMLRITLLTPDEVVRGKYIAGLRMAAIVCVLSLFCNAPLYFVATIQREAVPLYVAAQGSMFVCAVLAVSAALAVSVVVSRTSTAVVGAFIAGGILFFGAPFVLAMASGLFRGNVGEVNLFYAFSSPVVGFFYAADEYFQQNWGMRSGLTFLLMWGVNCIEFLVVAVGIYLWTAGYYRNIRARDR